jgi:hypothetical protein
MYATLEANSHCNKKRKGEKGRLKNCGSTARQPVRQSDRQARVCERDDRARFTFFPDGSVVVVFFIRSFLVRTHFLS